MAIPADIRTQALAHVTLAYDRIAPAAGVGPLLAEIGDDPYGSFWG